MPVFCSLKRRYAGCKDTGLPRKAESTCLSAQLQERGSPLSLCILEVGTGGACRFRRRQAEGYALVLLPGRVVLQQDSRISETADPGAQFRFAAGGQGQDEATIFAVLDLLVRSRT